VLAAIELDQYQRYLSIKLEKKDLA